MPKLLNFGSVVPTTRLRNFQQVVNLPFTSISLGFSSANGMETLGTFFHEGTNQHIQVFAVPFAKAFANAAPFYVALFVFIPVETPANYYCCVWQISNSIYQQAFAANSGIQPRLTGIHFTPETMNMLAYLNTVSQVNSATSQPRYQLYLKATVPQGAFTKPISEIVTPNIWFAFNESFQTTLPTSSIVTIYGEFSELEWPPGSYTYKYDSYNTFQPKTVRGFKTGALSTANFNLTDGGFLSILGAVRNPLMTILAPGPIFPPFTYLQVRRDWQTVSYDFPVFQYEGWDLCVSQDMNLLGIESATGLSLTYNANLDCHIVCLDNFLTADRCAFKCQTTTGGLSSGYQLVSDPQANIGACVFQVNYNNTIYNGSAVMQGCEAVGPYFYFRDLFSGSTPFWSNSTSISRVDLAKGTYDVLNITPTIGSLTQYTIYAANPNNTMWAVRAPLPTGSGVTSITFTILEFTLPIEIDIVTPQAYPINVTDPRIFFNADDAI